MHNKKILAKGLIFGAVISATSVNSMANNDSEYNLLNINNNLSLLNKDKIKKENKVENSIKELKNNTINSKEVIIVNENIIEGKIYELTLNEGDFVPDLSGNPEGYEIIRVTTNGNKKLVKTDYDNLRLSGIPKIDLSNAYSDNIPAGAFYNATHLVEFKFPQGITSIGGGNNNGAFQGCSGLTGDLIIPDSVTSIGSHAFYRCSGFNGNLVIPDSVTSIESYAFSKCSGFNGNLVIPDSVTSIGRYAFRDCSGFNGNLVIPNSVTSIGSHAFYRCSGFNGNLVIPNSVTSIESSAFEGCSGFNGNLVIPNSVTSIGSHAFRDCSGFTGELTIPDSVISIESNAFRDCSGFNGNLVIPEGVTSIGNFAFYGCSGFNGNLVIPDSVTSIEYGAFQGCSGLTGDLIIPDSVTSIRSDAFYGCSGFTGELIIPDSVTSIGDYAFEGCSGFNGNLVIPDSVTSIGDYAFYGCIGFDGDLVIGRSLANIGADVFKECLNIKQAYIGVNNDDSAVNHRKTIVDKIYAIKEVMIDIPYDFNVVGTWLETTSKTVVKPVIKNIVNGIESELIDNKGEAVSLYIPSLYQESNISVLKDDNSYTLPVKDINGKYVFTESGVYELTVITDLGNISVINFEVEKPQFKNAKEAVEKAEGSEDLIDINDARDLVNNLPECTIKDELQDRLNNIFPDLTLESKSVTANLDLYIKSENMLLLSLDTNSITFEDFSGVEDMEKQNAINLTVNSSLPYKINAYLATEIENSDKSKTMNKDILNIRANGESNYNTFVDTITPIVLLDDQPADNNVSHGIDLMLKGNLAHEKDVYKTTIKFEAEQK